MIGNIFDNDKKDGIFDNEKFMQALLANLKKLPKKEKDLWVAACLENDYTKVKELLATGVNVNTKLPNKATLLHMVKDPKIAEMLLDAGADIEARDGKGNTPLLHQMVVEFTRSMYLSIEIFSESTKMETAVSELLIQRGANVKTTNDYGCTPLHFAPTPKIAEELIKKGAKVNAEMRPLLFSVTPLDLQCCRGLRYIRDINKEGFRFDHSTLVDGEMKYDMGNIAFDTGHVISKNGGNVAAFSFFSSENEGLLKKYLKKVIMTDEESEIMNKYLKKFQTDEATDENKKDSKAQTSEKVAVAKVLNNFIRNDIIDDLSSHQGKPLNTLAKSGEYYQEKDNLSAAAFLSSNKGKTC